MSQTKLIDEQIKRIIRLILSSTIILLELSFSTIIQAKNVNGIDNFSKTDYHAANQNWGVSAGKNGNMYFANHHGLLEFDGTSWQLYELPNKTIIRAVYAINDSLIFTSGYEEIGFWKRNKAGKLNYHSLKSKLPFKLYKNEEFWDIAVIDSTVYFHSFMRIICYNLQKKKLRMQELPAFSNTMSKVDSTIYIAVMNQGIYKLKGSRTVPECVDPFFKNKTVRFILPYSKNQLMIGTASSGIVIWDGHQLKEWDKSWTPYFKEKRLNRGYQTPSGDLIIGTIIDGITIFDSSGKFKKHYNTTSGLQNNTILGITTDQFQNIWLALDNGIDFIESNPAGDLKIENINSIGAIYTASIFDQKLYIGTNQGLFWRPLDNSQQAFHLVPNTQGQVWFSKIYDGHLIVGLNNGTWESPPKGGKIISRISGVFSIAKDPHNPNYLYESTYSNIVRLKKTKQGYVFDKEIGGFVNLIRFLEFDNWGNLWVSHMHKGIYRLRLNGERDSVISQRYYGKESVFGQEHSMNVFKIEQRIVFTTSRQLYTYDDLHDSIKPYTSLNKQLGEFSQAHRIVNAPNHNYWFITGSQIGLFHIQHNKANLIQSYPTILFSKTPLIDEYENILPLGPQKAILCLENGLSWITPSPEKSQHIISDFAPFIRELKFIHQGKDTIDNGSADKNLIMDYPHHNLFVRYSFPHYTSSPMYYQAKLLGLNQNWSEKSQTPQFQFDRLPPGEYRLLVKAVDIWGNTSQINQLLFTVAPPWYLSVLARIGYFILLIGGLVLFRYRIVYQTRKKEQKEKIAKEQEVIRLKNEKLNAEISHKSKELANSTIAMIKKNEFLMDLKQTLSQQKEKLGIRLPEKYYQSLIEKIDHNIDNQDDWKLFETNFEQAHELFLKRLKQDFPMLTNKDLRLCAYLRMNLSSKEIAPLLGISVRGVENHRYRVRKKMNLDHDENLTDVILNY